MKLLACTLFLPVFLGAQTPDPAPKPSGPAPMKAKAPVKPAEAPKAEVPKADPSKVETPDKQG